MLLREKKSAWVFIDVPKPWIHLWMLFISGWLVCYSLCCCRRLHGRRHCFGRNGCQDQSQRQGKDLYMINLLTNFTDSMNVFRNRFLEYRNNAPQKNLYVALIWLSEYKIDIIGPISEINSLITVISVDMEILTPSVSWISDTLKGLHMYCGTCGVYKNISPRISTKENV